MRIHCASSIQVAALRRTPAFDFDYLLYDYNNSIDNPSAARTNAFVQFDSIRTYDPPGSSTYDVTGFRVYNTAGKVVRDQDTNAITFFSYNAQGRLATSTVVSFDRLPMT